MVTLLPSGHQRNRSPSFALKYQSSINSVKSTANFSITPSRPYSAPRDAPSERESAPASEPPRYDTKGKHKSAGGASASRPVPSAPSISLLRDTGHEAAYPPSRPYSRPARCPDRESKHTGVRSPTIGYQRQTQVCCCRECEPAGAVCSV
jgi:hypothetical protein